MKFVENFMPHIKYSIHNSCYNYLYKKRAIELFLIFAFVFDTNACNTGRLNGTCHL